jgi:hypothetical protein
MAVGRARPVLIAIVLAIAVAHGVISHHSDSFSSLFVWLIDVK